MGRPPKEPTGRYKDAAEILRKAMEREDISRKELADKIGADGGERTVGNWLSGDTWPRDRELREKMRGVLGDRTVDAVENEVARVLGLPSVSPQEKQVLEVLADPEGEKVIRDAIDKLRERREKRAKK